MLYYITGVRCLLSIMLDWIFCVCKDSLGACHGVAAFDAVV